MNCCYIKYFGGGVCTNLSAYSVLITQNLIIVLFVNNSLSLLSYGSVLFVCMCE